MRFVLSSCLQQAAARCRAMAESWNGFWFAPRAPDMLGVIRILTGLMLVYTHAVWGLRLHDFFGADGWLSAEAVAMLQADQTVVSFWWWVPPGWTGMVHVVALVVLAVFTLGLFTRVTSILSFLIVISYANRVPAALFGLDQINAMLTLYLAIGPSGDAFSLDRLVARWRATRRADGANGARTAVGPPKSSGANLAIRLIQVHICVIYFFAGVSKLQGQAWWNGEAMWLAFANLEYQTTDMTWLAAYPWLVNVMTHVTVLWEISFCMLIWRPSLRPLVLFIAVPLHVGIGACLGMWTFGLAMLIGCSAFLPSELPRLAINRLRRRRDETEVHVPVRDAQPAASLQPPGSLAAPTVPGRLPLTGSAEFAIFETVPKPPTARRTWRVLRSVPAERHNGSETAQAAHDSREAATTAFPHAINLRAAKQRQATVLCIGRHTKARERLQKYLPRRGFWVMATSDPRKALSLLEANPPDCVLVLGGAMSKRELEKLQGRLHRRSPPSVGRVTVLSADQADWASSMAGPDAVRVVVEPVSLRDVRAEIESAIEQRAIEEQPVE